jgi:hypothetical protein
MGGDDLQEQKYCKEGIIDRNLNGGDESLFSCYIYQLTVLKVFGQTTMVIRKYSIPHSVDLQTTSIFLKWFPSS